jgi:hypothetical protein
MNKQRWLDAAEVFDSWRVVPRFLLFSYSLWVVKVVGSILLWYQHLAAPERTLEASGLAGGVITAVTGLSTWVFKIYSENGRDWSASATTSSTVVATSTSIPTVSPP